jgi:RNA polymerase sigma-70 factor (ECF subfamily)
MRIARKARAIRERGRSLQVHDWQAIVKQHGPAVWHTAYRLLRNHSDAADCFQETFLAAVEVARRERVRNIGGLLVRLATTRAIDILRRQQRHEQRQAGLPDLEPAGADTDPLEQIQTSDLASQLREAIGDLPPQEANVFCLRYLNEMSYREISHELKIATTVVGVALYRARAKLRVALGATEGRPDEVPYAKERQANTR